MQSQICCNIIPWCKSEKKCLFLRQRVKANLAFSPSHQDKFDKALTLVENMLVELERLQDKHLLVKVHLVESKIHLGLHGAQE